MSVELRGRVALVTGGASGIGRACAARLAEAGAVVCIADLGEERAGEAARAIASETGARMDHVALDVTDGPGVTAAVEDVVARCGGLDVVVAAAGVASADYVSGEVRPPSDDPEAGYLINRTTPDWDRVLAVNLTGVMVTNRVSARQMIALGRPGSIVNIASIAGKVPLAGAADYCVSKAGVVMLTKVLGVELAPHHIRVNAVGPGFIETPMTAAIRQNPEGFERVMAMTPMGRFGRPAEIASTVLFLASDESSYFSGQTLYANGGMFVG